MQVVSQDFECARLLARNSKCDDSVVVVFVCLDIFQVNCKKRTLYSQICRCQKLAKSDHM